MPTLDYAASIRPYLGQARSGDAAAFVDVNGGELAAIVDGLGHGEPAHDVASKAVRFIRSEASADLASLMEQLSAHLEGTIGAAVGLCYVDPSAATLSYVSVGNTVLRRFGSDDIRVPSQDGVVGVRMRTLRTQRVALEHGDVVLMHTDGISERFERSDYPEMLGHSADTIARMMVRRFGKQHDDAGCVAMRFTR